MVFFLNNCDEKKYFCHALKNVSEIEFTTNKTKEQFEDTKEVIRIRKSEKDRQNNGQKKKHKQRSTKHRAVPEG